MWRWGGIGVVRAGLWLTALVALLWVAPAAAAPPADRAEALAEYESVLRDEAVGAGWTGSVGGCKAGTESRESLEATLHTINVLRSFAGVAPVAFDQAKNERALATALMMRAEGDLSHDPGPSWACYSSEGAAGAGMANLYLGASGAEAMVGYVDDAGIDSLGHRRWVLDPGAVEFGSGSTGGSNALIVLDSYGDHSRVNALPDDNLVAWPPPTWVPWPWAFGDWSLAIGGRSSQYEVSLANAAVSVKVDGTPVPVKDVRDIGTGYGTGATLGWKPAIPSGMRAGDHRIDVSISGVTIAGIPTPISYSIDAFAPGAASEACDRAKRKLKKAKARLAKAKKGGSSREIAAAKAAVAKKRAKVKKVC